MTTCICIGQEWFTSFDVAKRMAIVQNKMLFVVWEDSFASGVPVYVRANDGKVSVIDLANDTSLDSIIRNYFIPVRISEAEYPEFLKAAEDRGYNYLNKLNDNSIKIMDVNGVILNVGSSYDIIDDLSVLIGTYALDTSFLNAELRNYMNEKNFLTSYLLADKYLDYSIYSNKALRPDVIDMAEVYLEEATKLISESDSDREALLQKMELTEIKRLLILERDGSANRKLKRIEKAQVHDINKRLYAFLNYTIFTLQDEASQAELWKSEISSLDLRKAEAIININKHGVNH